MANLYFTMCHNLNYPNIKIKCFRLFQISNKIFLIIKGWDICQHKTYSHCSPRKLHFNCKQQYIYDQSKDERVFH